MEQSKTSAYIETATLQRWSDQLSKVNTEAIETLDSYLGTVKELENYMLGNVSAGFINDTSNLVTTSKRYHLQMKNVEEFLIEVINTMSNQ